MQRSSRNLLIAALLGGAGFALAACGDSQPEWSKAQAPKENRVSIAKQEHIVRFAHGRADLSPAEAAQLADFLGNQAAQSGATISVGPATGPSGIGSSRERTVRDALARLGYRQVNVIHTGSDTGGPNQVAVVVNRYVVTTPRCPDFSKAPEYNYTNTTGSNFGCASAHNLGVMVADPADLARGRPTGAQDGTQAVLGVQRYRTGKVTPLIKDDTGSPSGSESGGQ